MDTLTARLVRKLPVLGRGYYFRWSRQELLELFAKNRRKAVNTAAIRAEPWKGYVTPEWWKAFPRGEPCRP